jgi:hypothetical protein
MFRTLARDPFKAFFDCLSKIYEDGQNNTLPALSDETMLYWKEAVGDAGGV